MGFGLSALDRHLRDGRRRLLIAGGVAALLMASFQEVDTRAASRNDAVVATLEKDGYTLEAADVLFLRQFRDRFPPYRESSVLIRAKKSGDPYDLFIAFARLSPEGVVLSLSDPLPLTRTQGVEESRPTSIGEGLIAYTTVSYGTTTALHVLDLGGRDPGTYSEFTRLERLQTAITNAQETGQTNGIGHLSYLFDPPAERVTFAPRADGSLAIDADGHEVRIDPMTNAILEGASFVKPNHEEMARPSALIQWSVNRVRAIPWFGEERMQYVKAVAFTANDWLERTFGHHAAPSEKEIADELGDLNGGEPATPAFTNPEIGWPPAPLKAVFKNSMAGEGAWIPLDRDPFLKRAPGLPSPFMTTFIRTDKERPDTRIFITMWDPRQIALHMEAGTVEPTSATGNAGPGIIPRKAEILRRAVAGFNGGFQAIHGEYGMMAQGTLYLPPKPYAASIMELRDGSTATGSWPRSSEVPQEVLSFRQNMTALVEKGKFNPWGRTWWGGTPETWTDRIHTTRSGVCRTRENFIGYFWGSQISHEVLAQAMIAAGCDYGVHLDMNPGLAGFEFYNIDSASALPPMGRPLQKDWEYEGGFKELPELRVRARRMIKGMTHVNFPAWIHRNGRDFFYLTERPLLPGADLDGSGAEEGKWTVKGLPQHGFPYALASTSQKGSAAASPYRLLKIDPRMLREPGDDAPTVVTFAPNVLPAPPIASGSASARPVPTPVHGSPKVERLALTFTEAAFKITPLRDAKGTTLAEGFPASGHPAVVTLACVDEEEGMLHWLELGVGDKPSAAVTEEMDRILAQQGCGNRIALDHRVLLGGDITLAGTRPGKLPPRSVALARGTAPAARAMFEETQVVPWAVWHTLQAQRVRYFPKPKKPTPTTSASGSGPGAPPR